MANIESSLEVCKKFYTQTTRNANLTDEELELTRKFLSVCDHDVKEIYHTSGELDANDCSYEQEGLIFSLSKNFTNQYWNVLLLIISFQPMNAIDELIKFIDKMPKEIRDKIDTSDKQKYGIIIEDVMMDIENHLKTINSS